MMNAHCSQVDVVVIGSGPSGCIAGGKLAKDGFDVVMLERGQHPRLTVGENIIPDFWQYADLIGASDAIRDAGFVNKAGGMVEWDGQTSKMRFRDFGYDRPALHVEREEFDHILALHAQKCGARLIENATVRNVHFGDDAQRIDYDHDGKRRSISAKYVIDASGQGNVLARQLDERVLNPDFRFMAVWGYYKNSRYYGFDGESYPHEECHKTPPVTFQCSLAEAEHSGWVWHIPLRESTSIGFVLQREVVSELKKRFDNWHDRTDFLVKSEPKLHHLMQDAELIDDQFHFINNFSGHSAQLTGPGYFMAGDAAGFFDPIFSIGVTMGMFGGALAAWAAGECLRKPDKEARYQELYRQQLLGRIEIARGLALPHYASAPLDQARAGETLSLVSQTQMDLVAKVASMSKRSENLRRLIA